ncbi:MAG: hypothetical protein JSV65_13025 [Armatimonadota bacterium]|nr:MAG: hypothetical protein JSV65_13025 [Armatimonadota bacterium]
MLDCASPYRAEDFRVRDPDLYLACPHHRTTLAVVEQRPVRRRVWIPGVALVILAVLTAFFFARWRPAAPGGPVLHARIVPLDEVCMHEPAMIQLQIWNPGGGRCEQVILALDRSYEKHVTLTYIEPEPVDQRRTAKWDRFWFPGLEEGDVLDVHLHISPVKHGTWQFAAELMSPDAAGRERIEATLEIMP